MQYNMIFPVGLGIFESSFMRNWRQINHINSDRNETCVLGLLEMQTEGVYNSLALFFRISTAAVDSKWLPKDLI